MKGETFEKMGESHKLIFEGWEKWLSNECNQLILDKLYKYSTFTKIVMKITVTLTKILIITAIHCLEWSINFSKPGSSLHSNKAQIEIDIINMVIVGVKKGKFNY